MKYVSLISPNTNKDSTTDLASLCKNGHSIGPVIISDGYLFVKKGFRYYFLHKIKDPKVVDEYFDRDENFSLKDYLKNSFGIYLMCIPRLTFFSHINLF